MNTSIYSLMIAAVMTVTSISAASANNALSVNRHTGITNVKGEPTFKGSENFLKAFPNATFESSEKTGDFTKVKFNWNGDALEAFYDNKGALIATSHSIKPANLPLSVKMKIKNNYEDYWIFQAVEFFHTENGLCYYVIIKKDDKAVILQVDADGTTTTLKKLKN